MDTIPYQGRLSARQIIRLVITRSSILVSNSANSTRLSTTIQLLPPLSFLFFILSLVLSLSLPFSPRSSLLFAIFRSCPSVLLPLELRTHRIPPPTAAWPLSSGGSLPTEHVDRAALHNAETNHRCIGHDLTIRTHWPHVFPSFSAGF